MNNADVIKAIDEFPNLWFLIYLGVFYIAFQMWFQHLNMAIDTTGKIDFIKGEATRVTVALFALF